MLFSLKMAFIGSPIICVISPYVRIVVTPKISKIRGADRIKKWLIPKNVKKQYLKLKFRSSNIEKVPHKPLNISTHVKLI
jgi:hypothetical protein